MCEQPWVDLSSRPFALKPTMLTTALQRPPAVAPLDGKSLFPPFSHFILHSDENSWKTNICDKVLPESAFLLGENGGLKREISLASSTFQGKHFQLKFGTQASNNAVYKKVLRISTILPKSGSKEFNLKLNDFGWCSTLWLPKNCSTAFEPSVGERLVKIWWLRQDKIELSCSHLW